MDSIQLSVLDLCPVVSGRPASSALQDTLLLAQYVESIGYRRYWVAEHHSMAGIASASPEIIMGHIAQSTKTIRVGSGGIMLPNHAPLRIAEAFRTLEAFHPGRIDLGIGRAPGTNRSTAHALRRTLSAEGDDFLERLEELRGYLRSSFAMESPYEQVVAMPVSATSPEIWMLGSSDQGAQMAALLGLPYVFAQHFSPLSASAVLGLYRQTFKPSATLARPKAAVAIHVICAETDDEARRRALPSDISFYRYRTTGRSHPLPTFEEAEAGPLTPMERQQLRGMSFPKFVGSPDTLRKELVPFLADTRVEEAIVLTMIPDLDARRESYRLLADVLNPN